MSKFLRDTNNAKAIAIPPVFSDNSQAKNSGNLHFDRFPTFFTLPLTNA